MAINFPNDPATNPGDGGTWVDGDGNTWTVEIVSGEAIWTMTEAADTGGGGGGAVDSVAGKTGDVSLELQDLTDVTVDRSQAQLIVFDNPDEGTTAVFNPNSQSVYAYAGIRVRGDGAAQFVGGSGSTTGSRSCILSKDAEIQFSESPINANDNNYTVKIKVTNTDGDAMSYRAAPTLGADATDLVIPTMGQVRAAIASNGGTSVSLNDLSDVNYTQKGDDDSWTLEPVNLDEILFSGQDTPENVTRKFYTNTLYGIAFASYDDDNNGSYIYAHESKGIILRSPGDNGVLWIEGDSDTTTSQPEIRISNGNGTIETSTGNYIGFKMPAGVTEDITWTLPGTDGLSGYVLSTDGSGNLTFTAPPNPAVSVISYDIGYESTTAYKFTGPGLDGTELNPTLYFIRGQKYIFSNTLGAHPFQLQLVAGTGESPYTDGVTGDQPIDLGSFEWEVPMDAPSTIFYQCTAHAAMAGTIKVLDNSGAGGGGAVDSVNSQTGVVSLGIQDMNDYQANQLPDIPSPDETGLWNTRLVYHTKDGDGNYTFPGNGEWRCTYDLEDEDQNLQLGLTDTNADTISDSEWLALVNKYLIFQVDGVTYGPVLITLTAQNANLRLIKWQASDLDLSAQTWCEISDQGDAPPSVTTESRPLTISIGDLGPDADAPPEQGEALVWSGSASKFRPTALASVATSGDYNDLINAPSAGDAPVTSVNTETGDVSLGIQDMDDYALRLEAGVFVWDGVTETSSTNDGEFGADRYSGYNNNNWQWYNFYVGKEDKNGSTAVTDWIGSNLNNGDTDSYATFILKVPGLSIDTEVTAYIGSVYSGNYLMRLPRDVGVNPNQSDWLGLGTGSSTPFDGYEVEFYPKTLGSIIELAEDDVLQWNSARSKFEPTKLDYSQINNTPAPLARTTVEITTAALATDATEAGEITGTGASGLLIGAQTDVAAWIRLYTSSAASTQDAGRNKDTDPVPGSGVLFEALYTTFTEKPITPGTTYFNLAGDSKLYYRITNESAIDGTPITVTFKILPLE